MPKKKKIKKMAKRKSSSKKQKKKKSKPALVDEQSDDEQTESDQSHHSEPKATIQVGPSHTQSKPESTPKDTTFKNLENIVPTMNPLKLNMMII